MTNAWTGGQYSLFRAILGAYLFVHFAELIPWAPELFSSAGVFPAEASPLGRFFPNVLAWYDPPWFATSLMCAAAGLSLLFAAGRADRWAALGLWYVWACLLGRNPLISNPSLPYVGWILLAHAAAVPAAPYGAWDAHARVDPRGGWRMPDGVFAAAWVLMAVGYSYSGLTKLVSPSWIDGSALARVLENPLARDWPPNWLLRALPEPALRLASWGGLGLEILFAPLALSARLRPLLWAAMLAMHLQLVMLIDFADLSAGMILLHLYTFDPGWVQPLATRAPTVVFYDGSCGLCHRWVRFLLAEDRSGTAFTFAPLGGERFRAALREAENGEALPDSILVLDQAGGRLTRSAAILHLLERLGGWWRLLSFAGRLLPARARDAAYDRVAAVRKRVFEKPKDACPMLPPDLRSRFEV